METIHFVDIPDTLTKELLVKCIYDNYLPIRQAALKKVICDNLLSDTPLVDLWEVDWSKLKIDMPGLSSVIYEYTLQYGTYQKGLEIFDTILSKRIYYPTYEYLYYLLKSKVINSDLKQSILSVIKKYTSEKTEILISTLFLKRADIPELGEIILYMLENTKDIAKLCTKFRIEDVICKHKWKDEYLPKICNIIIPHMDMLSLLRIFELCEYNKRLDAVEENIATQILKLINNMDESQANDKYFCQYAVDIAEFLSERLGIKIFRLLVQKHQYKFIDDYIYYITYNKDVYPEQEFDFIFQNVGAEINKAYIGIAHCISIYNRNIELIPKFITALDKNQYLVPALVKDYSNALVVVDSIQNAINETYGKIEQLNKLTMLPQPAEPHQDKYKNLIKSYTKLIEKIYASFSNNGTACAEIALKLGPLWKKYHKMWNINDAEFKQDFLNHCCRNNSNVSRLIQKEFCQICNISLPQIEPQQDTPYDIDYIIAVLKLLDGKIND